MPTACSRRARRTSIRWPFTRVNDAASHPSDAPARVLEWSVTPLPGRAIILQGTQKTEEAPEIVVAGYPFLDVVWTTVLVVAFIVFVWMVVSALRDVYRRDDIGGAKKAGWTLLVVLVPLVGVFAYLIASGDGMARRSAERR